MQLYHSVFHWLNLLVWDLSDILDLRKECCKHLWCKGLPCLSSKLVGEATGLALIFSFRFKLLMQQTDKGTTWKRGALNCDQILSSLLISLWAVLKNLACDYLKMFPVFSHLSSTSFNHFELSSKFSVNFNVLLFNLFRLPWHIVRLRALSGAQKSWCAQHFKCLMAADMVKHQTPASGGKSEAGTTNYVQIIGTAAYAKTIVKKRTRMLRWKAFNNFSTGF